MTKPQFDDADQTILDKRESTRNARTGPRIGDFIEMPDGRTMRFSHDWGDDIQISEGGSYYLGNTGVSMSGGLEPAIDKTKIATTDRARPGSFWFFHHDMSGADRGVYFTIPCRVYRYTGEFAQRTYPNPPYGEGVWTTYS